MYLQDRQGAHLSHRSVCPPPAPGGVVWTRWWTVCLCADRGWLTTWWGRHRLVMSFMTPSVNSSGTLSLSHHHLLMFYDCSSAGSVCYYFECLFLLCVFVCLLFTRLHLSLGPACLVIKIKIKIKTSNFSGQAIPHANTSVRTETLASVGRCMRGEDF